MVGGNDPGGLHVFDKNNPKQARKISLNRADIPMGIVDAGSGKIYVGLQSDRCSPILSQPFNRTIQHGKEVDA